MAGGWIGHTPQSGDSRLLHFWARSGGASVRMAPIVDAFGGQLQAQAIQLPSQQRRRFGRLVGGLLQQGDARLGAPLLIQAVGQGMNQPCVST